MSKPIKCPSCNKNMYILSGAIAGEDNLYSAKVECPMCMTRFCHVVMTGEERARRRTAKRTREWIAKLKTCEDVGKCILKVNYDWMHLPKAPGSRGRPLECPPGVVMYGCGMPDSITYSGIPTVTHATTSVVKMSVDELMSLRSQGLLSDTRKESDHEVP